jgi:hypothetical protein
MATTGIFGAGVDQRVLDVVHCDVPWNMVDLIQEQNRGAVMFIPEGRPPIDCPESAPFGSHLLVPWAMDAHECRRVKMSLFLDGVSILCFDVPSGVLCDICCTEVVSPTREVPLIAEETQIAPADYAPPLILDDIVNPAPTDKGKGRAHHGPLLARLALRSFISPLPNQYKCQLCAGPSLGCCQVHSAAVPEILTDLSLSGIRPSARCLAFSMANPPSSLQCRCLTLVIFMKLNRL